MSTVNVATSYITDKVYVNKIGGMITEEEKIGFTGTKTVAKLKSGRTYNFATKVENAESGYQYKAVFITKGNGNLLSREFVTDGKEQSFSITLGEDEHTIYINNSEGVKVVVSYEQEADFDPKPSDFKTPQPFRFWCQTVLPLVYDDSLSYYELLSKVVSYLNSLINDVTNVENIYTNLTNAYTQLEAYVNTYFDNLDVSEAINAKLDYMAEHGDFDSLVQEALSRINYTAIIDAEVDEQLPSVVDAKLGAEVASQIGNVVENQIDDVVHEQIGGAVSNQIGETVANQIGDVVEDQIGNVVADQIDEAVVRPTENWLSQNFETPPVDKTLSIDNAAADAKVTGSILDYLKSIEILGVNRQEVNLSSQMRKFSQCYIGEVTGTGTQDAFKISINKPNYNCAYIRGLIGGARYKISLNANDATLAQIGEGWLCRNLLVSDLPFATMYATKIDTLENRIGFRANGDYYIDIPYNCDAILFNSLNSRICDLSIVTMTFDGNILPFVTSADNGKVLSVANGEWEATEIPSGNLPPVTTGDNGKVLQVSSGNWGVGEDLSEIADSVDELENHYTITPSLNLFDPSTVEEGVFCKNINLTRSAGANYNVVTVEVEPETSYVFAEARPSAMQSETSAWRYIVFCDETMTGISLLDAGVDGYSYGGFTTPIGTKYAVISYRNANVKPLVFEHAIPENWNSRYEYTSPDPTYLLKSDVVLSPASLSTSGLNIIDESQLIDGYVQSGSYVSASGSYKCTPIIPVKPNTTYYSKTNMRYYCLYNEQKQYIHGDGGNALKTFTTTADDRYVRISVFIGDAGKYMVSDNENALYEPYKKVFVEHSPMLNNTQKADIENSLYLGNKLKGKKWVVCGDSFTADGGTGTTISGGLYNGKNYVYPYIIGNRTGAEIVSFAAGGRSMGYLNDPDNPSNNNSLTCPTADWYYQNIPVDADYITIYLGINDVNHNIPMGTINDNDSSTYLGAYNEVISWLIENRPFAHIGIIVTNGTGSNDMTLGQIAIAEKYGIPYINMNGDARTPVMLRSTNPNIPSSVKDIILAKQAVNPPSNTHPNDDAQLYESTFIENFLMSI